MQQTFKLKIAGATMRLQTDSDQAAARIVNGDIQR